MAETINSLEDLGTAAAVTAQPGFTHTRAIAFLRLPVA